MTSLPGRARDKRLGLVIDLDTCVGCHACAVACKSWNTGGLYGPLGDVDPYGSAPDGTWLNRIHSYEVDDDNAGRTVHFPKSCLHCENAACVTVCPTGASYKRVDDGVVLVDEDLCIGCQLCAWACPYGAREFDHLSGVMKKCTLCADRIDNGDPDTRDALPACVNACPTSARHFGDLADPDSSVAKLVAARGQVELLPEMDYRPTNVYLPPRPRGPGAATGAPPLQSASPEGGFLGWVDRMLSSLESP